MIDSSPKLLHLYETKAQFVLNDSIHKMFRIETYPFDPLYLIDNAPFIVIIEVDTFSHHHFEAISNAFIHGRSFVTVVVSNRKNDESYRALSLLTHSVSCSIPQSEDENNLLLVTLLPMFQVQLERFNYLEALKLRSHRSGLVDSLNVVAHQWRQPINLISMEAINLSIQSSLDTHIPSPSVQQSAQIISEQSQRMADILKSVLNMGKTHRKNEPFSINEMIDRIEFFFADQLKRYHIRLNFVRLEEDTLLQGYQTDMEEVLVNLIANAKDAFTSFKDATDTKFIVVGAVLSLDSIILTVRDNAGGVPKEIREKIFEPNFSTKGEGEGFGIGLHVARSIISQEFKGSLTLSVDSDQTLFTIIVPRTDSSKLKFIDS